MAGTWLLVTECVLGLSHAHLMLLDQNANPAFGVTQVAKLKKKTRKSLGRILLKGDNITLMISTAQAQAQAS